MQTTPYNFTNLDKTDSPISNSGITFGVFPMNCMEPKVPKNASDYQNGRVFEDDGREKNRILSVPPPPKPLKGISIRRLGLEKV